MWYPFTAHERNTSVPETKEDDGFLKKSVKKKIPRISCLQNATYFLLTMESRRLNVKKISETFDWSLLIPKKKN